MDATRYLLIGGGLAAAKAAEGIRSIDKKGRIIIAGAESRYPYDRPPLSKDLLRGEMKPSDVRTKNRRFYRQNHVRVILGSSVKSIYIGEDRRIAQLGGGREITFEKCLLATGGRPKRLHVPGEDLPGIHYLRTVDDSQAIAAEAGPGRRAVVVGAGFIGMEVAASLRAKGTDVVVIERMSRVWPEFADEEVSAYIQQFEESHGIEFLLNNSVTAFGASIRNERVASVTTESGKELPCDFVCVAIGIDLELDLAERLRLTIDNGVVANEYLEAESREATRVAATDSGGAPSPRVFVAGDILNFPDPFFGVRRRVEHFGQAEYTGLLAGMNMAGAKKPYDLLTYVWSDLFDLHVEFAGNEKLRDRTLIRGNPSEGKFIALHMYGSKMNAFLAINTPESEFGPLRMMIQQRTDLTGRDSELADATKPLAGLVGAR